jgi:tetratricopeptide (TPR) repeat protein
MGFDYVLTGSVQRSGQQLRVTAKLTEVSEGAQLWSQHFDGNLADVFSMQDHITSQVVSVVEPVIRMKESALALRRHPASSDAYDFYLRALPYVIAFNPSANVTALGYLNQALALDSEYLPALVNAAWCYEQRLIRHWSIANESQRSKAISLARRALVKPSNDARSIALAGYVLFMAGHLHEDGLGVLQRAASLNPNDVTVLSLAGIGHLFLGDIDTAEPYLERAMLLSNAAPDAFMPMTSLAALQFFRGNYTAALKLANKSVASNPNWDFSWWVIIAAAAETGNQSRVNEAIESLERFAPDFDQAQLIWEIFINVDHRLLWTNSLLKAKALHAKRE